MKKKHEEHENHERWLVSYADFITLLFAFFVVMYSVSSVNEGKYRVLSDSLSSSFSKTKAVGDLSLMKMPVVKNQQIVVKESQKSKTMHGRFLKWPMRLAHRRCPKA